MLRIYRRAVIDVKSKAHHLVDSRVNLKKSFRKSNYVQGSFDVGRLQDENLRGTFQEQLNTKLQSSKFDKVEYGWNNFRKTICEIADGVLGKKVMTSARDIPEKALYLIKRGEGVSTRII